MNCGQTEGLPDLAARTHFARRQVDEQAYFASGIRTTRLRRREHCLRVELNADGARGKEHSNLFAVPQY